MPARLQLVACVAASWISTAPPHAYAEAADPPGYLDAVLVGLEEYDAGNYAEARSHFLRANRLSPNARTFRGLGMTEYALQNYPEAVRLLEASLASDIKPLDKALRRQVAALLTRVRSYVDRVRLRLDPATANVWVDGVSTTLPASRELLLGLGDHQLDVRARGMRSEARRLTVQGGAVRELSITLAPEVTSRTRSDEPQWHQSPWLWAGIGAVVAGAVVVGVIAASSRPVETKLGTIRSGNTNVVLRAP